MEKTATFTNQSLHKKAVVSLEAGARIGLVTALARSALRLRKPMLNVIAAPDASFVVIAHS